MCYNYIKVKTKISLVPKKKEKKKKRQTKTANTGFGMVYFLIVLFRSDKSQNPTKRDKYRNKLNIQIYSTWRSPTPDCLNRTLR